MKNFSTIVVLFLIFSLLSCDHGISPLPEQPEVSGFEGTIYFVSPWPDSIKRTYLVVFKNPLLQPSDFVITNLKYLSNEIPFGVQSYRFSSLDSAIIPVSPGPFEPGEYAYVAVAHQTTHELSLARKDWFVSGIYYSNNDTTKPGVLVIQENKMTSNVNIRVDFNHLPTQPPGE
ncbi:Hypothetical protein IALB_2162 [Ignavibacterium album JCM 16511]|uniref:Lipoprotein n=1 Tax=Ignavibacterium album (strain DSM 19864 / JCM 16511 / NBRC 101810 / Mat9-16) TaxID=945713 RepID=I0ALL0_IGNAJ|nr:hypothetical protein [Ignavibacterium album]AFH49867.1 Hypothetical protein IALB_2162 [Ignavibacterium album JCM 16511]